YAAERDHPAARLEMPPGQEHSREDAKEEAGEVVEVGAQAQPQRDANGGVDGPHEPVEQEVAEAEEELGALALLIRVALLPAEGVDHHRRQGDAQHDEDAQAATSGGDGAV